jgi:hypothetical protein
MRSLPVRAFATAFLHEDAVAIASVVVADLGDRHVAEATVERLGWPVLVLDHQGVEISRKFLLQRGEQERTDPAPSPSWCHAEVEDTRMAAALVSHHAPDDLVRDPCDQHPNTRPEPENDEGPQAVRLAQLEAGTLELGELGKVTEARWLDPELLARDPFDSHQANRLPGHRSSPRGHHDTVPSGHWCRRRTSSRGAHPLLPGKVTVPASR